MRISVITINLNNREGLRKTIKSVVEQTVPPFEFIVIDGASTDGSKDLLQEYAPHISYGISEADRGIYSAMNKGVRNANGDYCLFLNSGDTLCYGSVIESLVSSGAKADILCGNVILQENPPRRKAAPAEITMRTLYSQSLCHQGALIRTDLLLECPYDESLKIVADRKFFFEQLVLNNVPYQPLDIDMVNYDISGYSSRNRFASEQEWLTVLRKLVPERILLDYGRETDGALFGLSSYDRLFLEIKRRRWKNPVYRLVKALLQFMALFIPSARFVRKF